MAQHIFNIPLDSSTGSGLRSRTSEKWKVFPPDVLPAFVAEMDCALAPAVAAALHDAIERGDTGYASPQAVRAPFAAFADQRYGWKVDERAIFAVPDVMAGIAQAMLVLTPPGAPIVINPPVYPPFFEVIETYGRRIVEVPLARDGGGRYELDFDALESCFAELRGKRAAYLLCSPHNPVGRVWTRDEIARVAALCSEYAVALISDEIHAPLVLPGAAFTPALPIAADAGVRAVAMHSASKGWNLAGLKCGLAIAGESVRAEFQQRLKRVATEIDARIGQFGIVATVAAFSRSVEWLDALICELDGNRAHLRALIAAKLPQLRYAQPEGTYLAWLDCSALDLRGARDAASFFLNRGRVALERGARFGNEGKPYVRLNFATSREVLDEIVTRMSLSC